MNPPPPRRAGLRLEDLARDLPTPADVVGDPSVRVLGVHQDSRRVEQGDLFVARRGERTDGDRFVSDAVARGASAVLLARASSALAASAGVPALLVDDPSAALAHVASAVYGHPSFTLDVVGVTGTNGKTTTAHLVRAAVDGALGRPSCGVIGTLGHAFDGWRAGTELTTPEPDELARVMAGMRDRGATHAAMEVSSHALELGRVRAVRFLVAAFTNLTQDHLDFHRTMAAYRRAKERLFVELGPAVAVLNVDDPVGRDLADRLAARESAIVVRVTADPATRPGDAEIAPLAPARLDARGVHVDIRTPGPIVTIASRLVGAHNRDNLLLALGIALALDLDVARAAAALSQAEPVPGRLERCDREGDDLTVLVDYAHTPDALARVLDALRDTAGGARLWCVFGCGGDRDPTKRGPMGEAVGRRADEVIVTNDNPRTEDPQAIAEAVVAGVRRSGKEPALELDRSKAIERAVLAASPGDVVLVAGKGHEDYQIVGTVKHPFDDRLASRSALDSRLAGRAGRGVAAARVGAPRPSGGDREDG